MRNWVLENFVCESMHHHRYGRYESRFGANELRYEVFPTPSGKSYPWFLISARILHIILIFIPHLSLSRPQLNHHRRTQSWVIPLYLSMTWSWVDTEYSIHRVQHPPKIVCLPFILMITSWPLNVASASGIPPYTIDRHQPALHESSKVK